MSAVRLPKKEKCSSILSIVVSIRVFFKLLMYTIFCFGNKKSYRHAQSKSFFFIHMTN